MYKTIAKGFLWLFLILMGVLITLNSIKYLFPYTQPSSFLRSKQDHFSVYLPALYGHAFSAGLILIVGFLGFSRMIRQKSIKWHRYFGRIYTYGILFLSAPCGLVMALYADGKTHVSICFLLLSLFWWIFTWIAWQTAKKSQIESHRWWMTRSYALAVSAINLRVYLFIAAIGFDFRGPEAYEWIAWLSWVPNLILVEIFYLLRKKQ